MAATNLFALTPRRFPRLAAVKNCFSNSSSVVTPLRDLIIKRIRKESVLEGLEHYIKHESSYASLNVQLVKAEVEVNCVHEFMVVTRKLKSFNSKTGPYDAIKVLVKEDGCFPLLVYDKVMSEGTVEEPFSSSSLVPALNVLADCSQVICKGIQEYSIFQRSIYRV